VRLSRRRNEDEDAKEKVRLSLYLKDFFFWAIDISVVLLVDYERITVPKLYIILQ
jgi:hypothetical protein